MSDRGQRESRHVERGGFTLMEVLLVLAILVVLGSMAVQVFSGTQAQAEKKAAQAQVAIFERAIDLYKFDCKKLPGGIEDLIQEPSDNELTDRWAGPYIKGSKTPKDPWDNPYRYSATGKRNANGYDVWSLGPDGQDGTDDDIGNWES